MSKWSKTVTPAVLGAENRGPVTTRGPGLPPAWADSRNELGPAPVGARRGGYSPRIFLAFLMSSTASTTSTRSSARPER
jgi:hypothetical protein